MERREMNSNRRIVRVGISFPLLFNIMQKGYRTNSEIECTDGLPEGSEYIYSYVDSHTQALYMVFRHDSFDEVEVGAIIPEAYIVHKKIYHAPLGNAE